MKTYALDGCNLAGVYCGAGHQGEEREEVNDLHFGVETDAEWSCWEYDTIVAEGVDTAQADIKSDLVSRELTQLRRTTPHPLDRRR